METREFDKKTKYQNLGKLYKKLGKIMNIYYFANSIYQFPYALPIYNQIGGTFVVRTKKKFYHFKRYLRGMARFGEKTFLKTPRVIIVPRNELYKLKGIILFLANSINPKHEYKNAITIFHEHGTSDKKYGGGSDLTGEKLKKYDYIFLSGPKNKERLRDANLDIPDKKLIEIGGLRFDNYVLGNIDRDIEMQRLGIKDPTRKNILYAPTWRFGNGTLRQYAFPFIQEITQKYNFIIRPHYHDRRYGPLVYYISKLKGIKHLYFSQPANLIKHDTYFAFAVSDLMLSDVSSVIYEYLITRKPIIIVQNDFQQKHTMPSEMDIFQHVDIYDGKENIVHLIEQNLDNASQKRQTYERLLNNCFYSTRGNCVSQAVSFINRLKGQLYEKISNDN